MGRIVAIDYGIKRTGLATTDPLKLIATPLESVQTTSLMGFLKKYAENNEVEAWVVGMPKKMNNQPSQIAPLVERFVTSLKSFFAPTPIYLIDERFTSIQATQTILASGINKKKRQQKGETDKISATLILQSYLASPTKHPLPVEKIPL